MICYGIATRTENNSFIWHIPGSKLTNFFAEQIAKSIQHEVALYFDKEVQTKQVIYYKKDNYFFSLFKEQDNCCIIAADCQLNAQQMAYLHINLFKAKVSQETVSQNLEQYTQKIHDPKIEQIHEKIADIKSTMADNAQMLLKRGENLALLEEQADALAKSSAEFKGKTKELNSCCTLL